jgi:hypothetical protein
MPLYSVEFMTNIYVTIPVEAHSREEAEALADKVLDRYSVWAETSDDLPDAEAWVDGKGWELNRDIDDEDEEDERVTIQMGGFSDSPSDA